jgi:hypothetical protein
MLVLTNTTGSHVGGNHDGALALSELVENPVSLLLLLVTVNGESRPAVLSQELGNVVSDTLGAGENQTLGLLVLHDGLEVLDKSVSLLVLGADLHNLGDVVRGRQLQRTNVDLNLVLEVVVGQSLDLLGPGSRPHEGLSVGSNLVDNLSNLRLETHIEHSVGLIENQVGHSSKVSLSGLEHIEKSAGSGNDNLHTSGKVSNLLASGNTSVDTGVSNLGRLAELGALLLNLNSQLSGGGEDQDDGSVTVGQHGLGVDVDNGGQAVRQSLTGTGGSDTNDISSGQGHGPSLALNGSGLLETLLLDLLEDVRGETSLVKVGHGLRDTVSVQGHLVLLSEGSDLLVGSLSDSRVLLVEVLLKLRELLKVPVLLGQVAKVVVLVASAAVAASVTSETSIATEAASTASGTTSATSASAEASSAAVASVVVVVIVTVRHFVCDVLLCCEEREDSGGWKATYGEEKFGSLHQLCDGPNSI